MGPGTNLSLASPLYPHLLPGLVCRWDLEVVEVGSSSQVDLSLEVTDLSLGDEETSEQPPQASNSPVSGGGAPSRISLAWCSPPSSQRR